MMPPMLLEVRESTCGLMAMAWGALARQSGVWSHEANKRGRWDFFIPFLKYFRHRHEESPKISDHQSPPMNLSESIDESYFTIPLDSTQAGALILTTCS